MTSSSSSSFTEKYPEKIQRGKQNTAPAISRARNQSILVANTEAEAVDFEPEDDDLMDEDSAVDVDASSSRRAPLPKLKSAITGGSAFPSLSAPKKTKGRGFREDVDTERQSRFSGLGFDSLGSDGGPGPQRSIPAPPSQLVPKREMVFSSETTTFRGWLFMLMGSVSFVGFLFAAVISKLLPLSDNSIISAIQNDSYYCFLVPLTLPILVSAVYFHWLSMKMFKHA